MVNLQNFLLQFSWRDIVDITVVTFLLYKLAVLIRGSRAEQLVKGLGIFLIITLITGELQLNTINWILRQLMTVGIVAIPIVFQPELRRALEHLGRGKLFLWRSNSYDPRDFYVMLEEVMKATQVMVKKKIGALIVFQRQTGLKDIIETGIKIDGKVSAELILNIFAPHSPLHDGACVVSNDRILAAGCYLNLTDNPGLSKELGTRHRAALGITETSDSVVLVVSEETGVISLAVNGKLTRHLDEKTLKRMLIDLCEPSASKSFQFWQWRSS